MTTTQTKKQGKRQRNKQTRKNSNNNRLCKKSTCKSLAWIQGNDEVWWSLLPYLEKCWKRWNAWQRLYSTQILRIHVYFPVSAFSSKDNWKLLQIYLRPKQFRETLNLRAYRCTVNNWWNVTVQMWHMNNSKWECTSFIIEPWFKFSVITERYKNDASKVEMFLFLSRSSERYMFLKILSNSRQ